MVSGWETSLNQLNSKLPGLNSLFLNQILALHTLRKVRSCQHGFLALVGLGTSKPVKKKSHGIHNKYQPNVVRLMVLEGVWALAMLGNQFKSA